MKVSSACRGECVATGGLCRPAHLCVAHLNCTKIKVEQFVFFFCDVVRWGGVVWGFREGRCDVSSGLSQPGGKSC